ncbi:MAG: saccharopine dehydrogenase family protein [Candidatus Hodarchaeales archaeon]|jgi:saccharopine dehydrogenase-like NADP-dependent oxidoreductase
MNIIVLGGGFIGGFIAKTLVENKKFNVTVADINKEKLKKLTDENNLKVIVADLADSVVIKKLISDQDLVVGALSGHLGIKMLRTVIESKKNIVDVTSGGSTNQLSLDELAKKNEVTAIIGMGLAPGMTNLIVGYVDSLLDKTESVSIYVGGLPVIRELPFEYKITWSIPDLLRMYCRPARLVIGGELIEKPPLSDKEIINLPGIGSLEAFNTDGLGSLIHTIDAPYMKEKTLRYPGHANKIQILHETGLLGEKPFEIGRTKIKPIDFTAKMLSSLLELKKGEKDLVIMQIIVGGQKEGKVLRYTYDLLDYYDNETKTTAMARNTGLPCAIMARLVAQREYTHKGISPPEYISRNNNIIFHRIMKELEKMNIKYEENVLEI